jgi:hypothetical protein
MQVATARTWRSARKSANDYLWDVGRQYHDHVPLAAIVAQLAELGIAVPESECILCGRDSRATFALEFEGREPNSMLVLMWHRMESGRYEITAYLS